MNIKLPWYVKLYCLIVAIFQTVYYVAKYGLYGAEKKLKEEREEFDKRLGKRGCVK